MARVEIAVQGLFATPLAAVEVPGAVASCVSVNDSPRSRRPNSGGWHSGRDIAAWGGPPVETIRSIAKNIGTQLIADRNGKPVQPIWSVQAWANVNSTGPGNTCHYHSGSFWSGTYYVADGECAGDPSLGGEFEMLDPRGPGTGMYAPNLKFAGEDGNAAGSAQIIRPRPGLLLLFPSWLHHQVRPYRGSGLRISIAFNLGVAAPSGA